MAPTWRTHSCEHKLTFPRWRPNSTLPLNRSPRHNLFMFRLTLASLAAACFAFSAFAQTPAPKAANHDLGFEDTPMLPGLPWHVHDDRRPHPHVVTPSSQPGGPPSDAIILF